MKTFFTFFLCAALTLISFNTYSQTALTAGDIVFTGYNCDDNTVNGAVSNDDITFMLLKNITAGTVISFTDFGWNAGVDVTGFQTVNPCGGNTGSAGDGVLQWTATADMTYGMQVNIRCTRSVSATAGTVAVIATTVNIPTDCLYLAFGGDQVFAFQGPINSPVLLTGLQMNGPWDATLSQCTYTFANSTLPAALSTNNYAFALLPEIDNARIKSSIVLSGNASTDRAAIYNVSNWDVNDVTAFALPVTGVTPLPVRLVSFSGLVNNGEVKLTWQVTEEDQLREYRIERSANGSEWSQIGTVTADGKSVYNYTDHSPLNALAYYRLKTVDIDGGFKYSSVISVSQDGAGLKALRISPNPVAGVANLQLSVIKRDRFTIRILTAAGAEVWQGNFDFPPGQYSVPLEKTAPLTKGIYFVEMISKETGVNQRTRFVKQ